MATENVDEGAQTANPASSPELLQPREYLRWLDSLERASGLPQGTRAYLVSVDHTGTRKLTAVPHQASVMVIEKELPRHLRESGNEMTTEALIEVREICGEILRQRSSDFDSRADLARKASWEIESTVDLLLPVIENSSEELVIKAMLRRIKKLACIQLSCFDEPGHEDEDVATLWERFHD